MKLGFPYSEIGARIRERRKNHLNKTQEEIRKLIGISRASLANIEAGNQRIYIHQLYSAAAALDMDITDLLPRPNPQKNRSDLPLANNVDLKLVSDINKIFSDE